MGGTCSSTASNSQIAAAVLTIPQTINTNNLTGTITYEYHHHTDSCYRTCGSTSFRGSAQVNGQGMTRNGWVCNNCEWCIYGPLGENAPSKPSACPNNINLCGYTDGQLIGATITY